MSGRLHKLGGYFSTVWITFRTRKFEKELTALLEKWEFSKQDIRIIIEIVEKVAWEEGDHE